MSSSTATTASARTGRSAAAELDVPSAQPYRGLEDLDYPFHNHPHRHLLRRICFDNRKIYLSTVFAGQKVGVKRRGAATGRREGNPHPTLVHEPERKQVGSGHLYRNMPPQFTIALGTTAPETDVRPASWREWNKPTRAVGAHGHGDLDSSYILQRDAGTLTYRNGSYSVPAICSRSNAASHFRAPDRRDLPLAELCVNRFVICEY
jgi:hypothetical protein